MIIPFNLIFCSSGVSREAKVFADCLVLGTAQPPGANWMVPVKNKPATPFGILGQKVKEMKIVNEIYRDA